jgi:hypothetical protein
MAMRLDLIFLTRNEGFVCLPFYCDIRITVLSLHLNYINVSKLIFIQN